MNDDILQTLLNDFLQSKDPSKITSYLEGITQSKSAANKESDATTKIESPRNTAPKTITTHVENQADFPHIEDFFSGLQQEIQEENSFHHTKNDDTDSHIGKYEKEGMLGKGGMGLVWKVRDPLLNRAVALKIVQKELLHDAKIKEDFEEEAQISAQLQHPGIVPIYSFDRLGNEGTYITMKEIKGKTLQDVISSVHSCNGETTKEGWNLRRLIDVFHSVCTTMAYAHNKGVIHRDLKPSNIMIGNYGEVFVVDWGIAKVVHPNTITDTEEEPVQTNRSMMGDLFVEDEILGTPAYMSPEQAWGRVRSMDRRSDIYSLGAILYKILTGETYHKGNIYQIIEQKRSGVLSTGLLEEAEERTQIDQDTFHITETAHPPREKSSSWCTLPRSFKGKPLPKGLILICEKAMQPVVQSRYNTTMELANDIQFWLDGVQRKEKAAAILEKVHIHEKSNTTLAEKSINLWDKANHMLSTEGLSSQEGWKTWSEVQKIQEQIEESRQEIHHLLQGALIYDPEMIEIHQKLTEFEYKEFLNALLEADQHLQKKISRRMKLYVENLPEEEVRYWRDREEKDKGSVTLLRKKRGSFIGRAKHKKEILLQLQQHRLLTLLGTAGVGKTHLSLEIITQWRAKGNRDAIFCDLTTATDTQGIEQVLAKALSLTLAPTDPWKQIYKAFASRQGLLLVFDNAEQVTYDLGLTIQKVLHALSDIKIIVTSRLKLGIEEEHLIRLKPMSILEGIELFSQRAQKAYPDFMLTSENRINVGHIVESLDRLPLAIELAAARASMLSVHEIQRRLSQRFSLLRGRMRDSQKQALLGALDWSWDLLSKALQAAFTQCSVFQDGFDLTAAESIIDVSNFPDAPGVMDILEALYDDNLLNKERQDNGRFRYTMLVSIQEYTRKKYDLLKEENPLLRSAPQRHAYYFGSLFQKIENQDQSKYLTELGNFLMGAENGLPEDAFLCCQAAIQHFRLKGPIMSAIDLAESFLARNDLHESHRTPIQISKVRCLRISGQTKRAREEMQHVQNIKPGLPDAHAKTSIAQEAIQSTSASMDSAYIEQAQSYIKIAKLHEDEAQLEEARTNYIESLRLYNIASHMFGVIEVELAIASLYGKEGQYQKALDQLQKAHSIIQSHGSPAQFMVFLVRMGALQVNNKMYEEAIKTYLEALLLYQEQGNHIQESRIFDALSFAYEKQGKYEDARTSLEEATALYQKLGMTKKQAQNLRKLGTLAQQDEDPTKALLYHKQAVHCFHMLEDAHQEQEILYIIGETYANQEQWNQALQYFQAALALCSDTSTHTKSQLNAAIVKIRAHLEQALADTQKQSDRDNPKECEDENSLRNQADTLLERGKIEETESMFDKALELFHQARNIYKKIKYHQGIIDSNLNLADIYLILSDKEKAYEKYKESLTIATEHELIGEKSRSLLGMGKIYFYQGDSTKAKQCFIQAHDISKTLDDQTKETNCLIHLGLLCRQTNELEEAIGYLKQAIEKNKTIGNLRTEGVIFGNLADSYNILGCFEEAIDCYKQAISIAQKVGNRKGEGINTGNLGSAYVLVNNHEKALLHYEQSLAIAKEIGNKDGEGVALGNMGDYYLTQKEYDKSEELFTAAIDVCRANSPVATGAFLGSLAWAYTQKNQIEKSFSLLEEAEPLLKNAATEYGKFLCTKAKIFHTANRRQHAYNILQQLETLVQNNNVQEKSALGQAIHEAKTFISSHTPNDDETMSSYCTPEDMKKQQLQAERFMEQGNLDETESLYDEAINAYKNAMEIYSHIDHINGVIEVHLKVGHVHQRQGNYDAAQEECAIALQKAEDHNFSLQKAIAIKQLGQIQNSKGNGLVALEYFQQSLAISKQLGDRFQEESSLGSIANVYHNLGQNEQAIQYNKEALQIAKDIGDKRREGNILGNLGSIYITMGEYKTSLSYNNDAMQIAKDIGDKRRESIILGNIGIIYSYLGECEQAIHCYNRSVQLSKEIGSRQGEGNALANLGNIYSNLGRTEEAIEHYNQAIQIFQSIGDKQREGVYLGNLANVHQNLGEYEKALSDYNKAMQIAIETENKRSEGTFLGNIGNLYKACGKNEDALFHYKKAIQRSQDVGHKKNEGVFLGNLGDLFITLHQWTQAEEMLLKSIEICKKTIPPAAGAFSGCLAWLYARQEKIDEAMQQLENGEPLVDVYPSEYGKFLCNKAKVLHLAQRTKQSREALQKAKSIAIKIKAKENTVLSKTIKETIEFISSSKIQTDEKTTLEQARSDESEEQRAMLLLQAETLIEQGNIDEAESLYASALESYNQALEIYTKTSDPEGLVETYIKIGTVHRRQGKMDSAEDKYTVALEISKEHNLSLLYSDSLTNLGKLQQSKGDNQSALKNILDALHIIQENGDRFREEVALGLIGHIYSDIGEYEKAIQQYNQAVEIAKEIGDKRHEGMYLGNLGHIYNNVGTNEKAIQCHTQALKIAQQIGDRRHEGIHLGNIGLTHMDLGNHDLAIDCYMQSLVIAREIGNKQAEGHALGNLGVIYKQQGDDEKAIQHYNQAIDIAKEIENKKVECVFLGNLGNIFSKRKEFDKAIQHYNQSIDIAKEIENKRNEGLYLGNLGNVFVQLQRWEESEQVLTKAIELCTTTLPPAAGSFSGSLAWVYALQSKQEEAIRVLEEGEKLINMIPFEFSKFLCIKAKILHRFNQTQDAQETLKKATSIAQKINATEDSELKKAIKEAAEFISSSPSTIKNGETGTSHTQEDIQSLQIQAEQFLEQGNLDEAESLYDAAISSYKKTQQIYMQIGMVKGIIETHLRLGKVYHIQGNYDAAQKESTIALQLSEEHNHILLRADALTLMGKNQQFLGDHVRSLEYLQQSMRIVQDVGDRFREESNLGSIASSYLKLGEYQKAIDHYNQALVIAKEIGNKRSEGTHFVNMGLVYKHLGAYQKALENYNQSLAIIRTIGDKRAEIASLTNIGIVYSNLGEYQKALEHYNQAQVLTENIGDIQGEELLLGLLGGIYVHLGEHQKAIEHYSQALVIAKEIGKTNQVSSNLSNLGVIYQELGEYQKAIEYYNQALVIAKKTGDKQGEGVLLGNLGIVHKGLQMYDKSISYYQLAIQLSSDIGNKTNEGIQLGNLGDLFITLQQWDNAEQHLLKAIEICHSTIKPAAGAFLGSLAWVQAQQNKMEEAKDAIQKGEPLVEVYPVEYGKFLCKKAKILHLLQQTEEASNTLKKSKSIAKNLNLTADSDLQTLISVTEDFLSSPH